MRVNLERPSSEPARGRPRKAIAQPQPNPSTEPTSPGVRLLMVLEAVAQFEDPVAAVDLVPRVDLPRATVHRLCVMLERLGFLQREPGSKRFVTGHRQAELAINSLIHSSHRAARHSALQALASEVDETVNVTVLDGNEVVYVDRVECQWPLRTHLQPGSRVPIHGGASGKLFLSVMPATKRRRVLAGPLLKYTENTITDPRALEEQLKQIRTAGYAVDLEEFMQGLIGLAVPVYDGRRRVCATVSLHAPTARLSADQVMKHIPAMQRSAETISRLLSRSSS